MRSNALVVVGAVAAARLAAAAPAISADDAAKLLYGASSPPVACEKLAALDRIECLIGDRYATDATAKPIALALFHRVGGVAGVGTDEIMDGGYRGKIHLVPELPIAKYRRHLEWVTAAMSEIDGFFARQFEAAAGTPAYRWTALAFRFVRSVGKHTPSAYAGSWSIVYNVEGSLLTSEPGVRETLFHELFHLNDEQHGDWSATTLGRDFDAIVAKCGTKPSCLAPYAPNATMVRGGTYYAFQPDNGAVVHEYAAELAVRYYNEQSEMLAHGALTRAAFKCGPPENRRAWHALVTEFFAGVDRVPACPAEPRPR